jgi:fido (protein-threonine AMPylation protein)
MFQWKTGLGLQQKLITNRKKIMLKNILNATDTQELSKAEQKSISGGVTRKSYCTNAMPQGRCIKDGKCPNGKTRWTCITL